MVLLDLINDEDITDIKITAHDDVRIKYKDGVIGRVDVSDFSTKEEYESFVGDMLREKRVIMLKDAVSERFFDNTSENCILKVVVSGAMVTLGEIYVHIRKLPKIGE